MKSDGPIDDTLTRYELWTDEDRLVFFPHGNESILSTLGPNARLVWSCLARTWDEAQTKKQEHLGWGPYIPAEP